MGDSFRLLPRSRFANNPQGKHEVLGVICRLELSPGPTQCFHPAMSCNQPQQLLCTQEFGRCGDILQWGTYGVPQSNFIHIQVSVDQGHGHAGAAEKMQLASFLSTACCLLPAATRLYFRMNKYVQGLHRAQDCKCISTSCHLSCVYACTV